MDFWQDHADQFAPALEEALRSLQSGTTRIAGGLKGPFSTPSCAYSCPKIPPIAFRSESKSARLRYFGTITMWDLQYHLTWERLCHSLMTVSFLVNVPAHVMETVSLRTP